MSEIVVGVDGSESSRAALRWAAQLAGAKDATLRAVTAWHYPASAASPLGPTGLAGPNEMDERTRDDLIAVLGEELGADAEHVEVTVGRGPAADVLLQSIGQQDAAMLVLGARGLGGFEGLLLGSVTQRCVDHSPRPVVVLRGEGISISGPIVVGLDGSEGAGRALDWALDLAEATGSEIIAVNAPGTAVAEDVLHAAEEALEAWTAPIRSRGIDHQQRVEPGDARSALEAVAHETGAALLVVGSRGLGPLRGLLLGSVAGYIVRYARRPVAVVRETQD